MSKNVVIFCDGTWNSPAEEEYGRPSPTNVYRLYQGSLNAADSGSTQVCWYQPGVGALGGKWRRAFEGATGTGLGRNIRQAYMALAHAYEPGDDIFIFGFSRGAFTARSIAGMVERVGLIHAPDISAVRAKYREYMSGRPGRTQEGKARIKCVGVWDTVGALGAPLWGWSFNIRYLRNGFHQLSPNDAVDHVFHALAMDEMRVSFMPTLWERPCKGSTGPCLEEVWFRGVHGDVGGGYADSGLAEITLKWMAEHASTVGLQLRSGFLGSLNPDPDGRIHDSYVGALWTNAASWPRWYPPVPAQSGCGGLHHAVFARRAGFVRNGGISGLQPGESRTVEVRGDRLWNFTGLVLERGAAYSLTAQGVWQDGQIAPVHAGGYVASWIGGVPRFMRRAPAENVMQLMVLVNHPRNWPWKELRLGKLLRYLLVEDPPELVAAQQAVPEAGLTLEPSETGILWAHANHRWKHFAQHTGSITLTVTRM